MIKWLKHKYFRWKLKNSIILLRKINTLFRRAGYSRQVIRAFWREAASNPEKMEELYKEILKDGRRTSMAGK